MRVMVIMKASADSEAGKMPSEKILTGMSKFNEALVEAGVLLAADGLTPSAKGKRVQMSASGVKVIDGPFAETKELIAGYWIWKVESVDEAVRWIRRMGDYMPSDMSTESQAAGGAEIEIRPVFEMEEFGKELTPAARAREEKLRARLASR